MPRLFVQTVRHRDYFLPVDTGHRDEHAPPPAASARRRSVLACCWYVWWRWLSCLLLAPVIQSGVGAIGPAAVVGVAIAMLVLLPETFAAARAARANRMQTSL